MHVLRYGAESRLNVLRYAMHVLRDGIGCFRHCATVFSTVRCFRKKNFRNMFPQALPAVRLRSLPTRLPSARAENYYGADN